MFLDIEGSENWQSVTPIEKGWSSDKKYLVLPQYGAPLLLRLSDVAQYEAKQKEYDIIGLFSQTGVRTSQPVAFGTCGGGQFVYMLLTWLEGSSLEDALPRLTEQEQYLLGRQAGKILKAIHAIPLRAEDIPAQTKKAKKLRQLAIYESSAVRVADDEAAVRFVRENIDAIWRSAPVYLHGDFHPGNLILGSDRTIGVIDFNRWEIGDPYEEFYKLESFGIELSVPYCIGQIDAYFNDNIPDAFWWAQAVYAAHASLYSIKWAEAFGEKDIAGMVRRCRATFGHYDNFRSVIP